MHGFTLALFSLASLVAAQNCGPKYNNQVCEAGKCCTSPFTMPSPPKSHLTFHPGSQYGWCDVGVAYCDPLTCLKNFSGADSKCAAASISTLRTTTKREISTAPTTATRTSFTNTAAVEPPYESQVPVIDVCGNAQGGVSCPGAGLGGYFYRCCSSAGHCGPKNDIQDQNIYCGVGCQAGYGKCDEEEKPPVPTGTPGVSGEGETCGPIVNKRCGDGLCCSGSNFCGTGVSGAIVIKESVTNVYEQVDFCGADNWCQKDWGRCL